MSNLLPEDRIFSCLKLPERTVKPREYGITMVEGDYMCAVAGMHWLQDLVEWGGEWIDYFKVGHPMRFQKKELVLNKLELLRQNDIQPYVGGSTVEVALFQGCLEPFLKELKDLGINVVEISSTVLPLTIDQQLKMIQIAKSQGFKVFSEIGKKLIGIVGGPKKRMSVPLVIQHMKDCLNAGAYKVVYEHTEIEALWEEEGGPEMLSEISHQIGNENVMFEVPVSDWKVTSKFAGWYITNMGSNVNIGDISPKLTVQVESLRCGVSTRTSGGKLITNI